MHAATYEIQLFLNVVECLHDRVDLVADFGDDLVGVLHGHCEIIERPAQEDREPHRTKCEHDVENVFAGIEHRR